MTATKGQLRYPKGSFALNENLFLFDLDELDSVYQSYITNEQQNGLKTIKQWMHDYLMCPHQQLGRKGAVCPYVPKSVKQHGSLLTVISLDEFDREKFYQNILDYFAWFQDLAYSFGKHRVYRSIMMLIDIPNVNKEVIIEQAVMDLKHHFVSEKCMLGEFHALPPEKFGIRNPEFKPLWCPVPLLAIREMVETDIEFLKHDHSFLAQYKQFFEGIPTTS